MWWGRYGARQGALLVGAAGLAGLLMATATSATPAGASPSEASVRAIGAKADLPTVPAYSIPANPSIEHSFKPPAICSSKPLGAACVNAAVYDLDAARAKVLPKAGPYKVPANFVSLSPSEQVLVLTDLDRTAYHEPPILGESSTLDVWAAANNPTAPSTDPIPPGWPTSYVGFGGPQVYSYGGNSAGGSASLLPNVVFAYADWMYDDGPGGINLGCQPDDMSDCWGHRDNVLRNYSVCVGPSSSSCVDEYLSDLSYGLASGVNDSGEPAYSELFVGTPTLPGLESYTWSSAQAAGAGSRDYAVPSTTTVTVSPSPVAPGAKITYTAKVRPVPFETAKITWKGAASSCKSINVSKTTGTETCTAKAPTKAAKYHVIASFAGNAVVAHSVSKEIYYKVVDSH